MAEIKYIEINPDTRTPVLPEQEILLGVIEDKDVKSVYFKCPKIVEQDIDLSMHQIYVNYAAAKDKDGKALLLEEMFGSYHCEDVTDHGDCITFSWLMSDNVFVRDGFVAFKIYAVEGEETKWNTVPAVGKVLPSVPNLNVKIAERYPDVINQLFEKIDAILDDKYKTTSKEKEATWDGSSKVPVDYNNVTYYKLVQGTYEDLLNGFTYSVTLTDGTTKTQTVTSDEANNYIALDENGYYIICEGLFIIAPDVTGILLNPSLMTSVESFCFTARKTYLDSKYLSAPIASYDNLGESVIEGDLNSNVASGEYAHAGGEQTTASGTRAFAHGFQAKASNMGATTFGYQSEACGIASFAAGRSAKAIGNYSIALGLGAIAKGNNAYAAGYSHKSQDYNLTIEELLTIFETAFANDNVKGLFNAALGTNSVSMGKSNVAYGNAASAFGAYNRAKGGSSFACGCGTNAGGDYSFAGGYYTKAIDNQFAVGHYNDDSIAEKGTNSGIGTGTAFVIGNGTSDAKSNAFRVTYEGQPYAKMALTTTGCDYAEFFEWIDGNLEKEDRRGYFVTTDGEKIKKAEPGDYILGITSALPSVIGNGDECWKGRYILDKFGDFIVEEAEMEVLELDRETGEYAKVTKMIKKWKENPEYNPEEQYIHRKERPEWSTVGMLGVIAVRDDGTCKVNGFCEVSEGGIATTASTGYRVAARVADNVIKVIFR
ncbi:MAG: peptidase G2 autoproteolytic cleavage domain-containing protein [Schaedlerella sp.]|nr:peptidase G2 autoproteolytic cleavage domain-containing protein [Schaedlerella sp.]